LETNVRETIGSEGIIAVDLATSLERGFSKFSEKVEFYGYRVVVGQPTTAAKYVVDKRSPTWRGWKEVESVFDASHHRELQKWYNKGYTKVVSPLDIPIDKDDPTCYT
jgi:hypothetical protein